SLTALISCMLMKSMVLSSAEFTCTASPVYVSASDDDTELLDSLASHNYAPGSDTESKTSYTDQEDPSKEDPTEEDEPPPAWATPASPRRLTILV
ncbi:hypothetical protein Tco_1363579, partial [Tanacetum coccineum]